MLPNNLIRGTLSTLILKLLAERGQMYGYEIIRHLKEATHQEIHLKEGALYPSLHRLQEQGYLKTETRTVSGRGRKYYRLSAKGKRAAAEKTDQLQNFVNALQSFLNPTPDGR